ncbi:hypothetical protein RJ45_10185 [Photobacterium gaetbulicola]|uniref:Uncharacterized protein n=1 Tax=Photobacterium gaetbulicola TaxID=1295392 RepID=A0A0B9H4C7_9GAMM|nr:hypothetical protein [Photobacterium gaetbulicola]KHT63717.1 hypothetical protein RJ45_10185 [Photobacterium gaetbulicola]
MAITIRDIDKHYFMIEELKSITESNVTTKALIKGGYMAVELGKELEQEKEKRIKAEQALNDLQQKIQHYLSSHQALVDIAASKPTHN